MRKPFGKLILMLREAMAHEPSMTTLGDLAERFGEPVDRVMDALEADKILSGKPAYIDSTGYVYVDPMH
jgi:hypothetical protein